MKKPAPDQEGPIARVKGIGGIILGVSENRSWIELLYEGDLMHAEKVEFPSETLLDIFVEEIPHKTTIYEYPRTLIYLDGPCDIEICREGNKVVVRGCGEKEG